MSLIRQTFITWPNPVYTLFKSLKFTIYELHRISNWNQSTTNKKKQYLNRSRRWSQFFSPFFACTKAYQSPLFFGFTISIHFAGNVEMIVCFNINNYTTTKHINAAAATTTEMKIYTHTRICTHTINSFQLLLTFMWNVRINCNHISYFWIIAFWWSTPWVGKHESEKWRWSGLISRWIKHWTLWNDKMWKCGAA